MALLTKDQILRAKDTVTEDVDVPEWGGTVRVKGMTGRERDQWEQSLLTPGKNGKAPTPDMDNNRAKLVAATVVDEQGNRIFTAEDVGLLGNKSGAALERVVNVAMRLSGISPQDMDDLSGNSSATTSGGSPSA